MSDYDLNWDNSTERAVAALRARLAEVEAERDHQIEQRALAALDYEARLGEAVELLRRARNHPVGPLLYADIRAFLARTVPASDDAAAQG